MIKIISFKKVLKMKIGFELNFSQKLDNELNDFKIKSNEKCV